MIKFYKILVLTSVALTLSVGAMEQPKDNNMEEQKSFAFNELPVDLQKSTVDNALIDNIFKDIGRLRLVCSKFNNYLRDKEVLKKIIGCCSFLEQYTPVMRKGIKHYLAHMLTKEKLTFSNEGFMKYLHDKESLFEFMNRKQRNFAKVQVLSVNDMSDLMLNFELLLAFVLDPEIDFWNNASFKAGIPYLKHLIKVFTWGESSKIDKLGVLSDVESALKSLSEDNKNELMLPVILNYRKTFLEIANESNNLLFIYYQAENKMIEEICKKVGVEGDCLTLEVKHLSNFYENILKQLPLSDEDKHLLKAVQDSDSEYIKTKIKPGVRISGDSGILQLAIRRAMYEDRSIAKYLLGCLPPITIENYVQWIIKTLLICECIDSLIPSGNKMTINCKHDFELFKCFLVYLRTMKVSEEMKKAKDILIERYEDIYLVPGHNS